MAKNSGDALDMITSNVTMVEMGWLKSLFKEFCSSQDRQALKWLSKFNDGSSSKDAYGNLGDTVLRSCSKEPLDLMRGNAYDTHLFIYLPVTVHAV
jgi:hypothetical protein